MLVAFGVEAANFAPRLPLGSHHPFRARECVDMRAVPCCRLGQAPLAPTPRPRPYPACQGCGPGARQAQCTVEDAQQHAAEALQALVVRAPRRLEARHAARPGGVHSAERHTGRGAGAGALRLGAPGIWLYATAARSLRQALSRHTGVHGPGMGPGTGCRVWGAGYGGSCRAPHQTLPLGPMANFCCSTGHLPARAGSVSA